MVIHSRGVCCGTSYFAPHVLRPSIAFTMHFNVGDKVFHSPPMGCAFLLQWWGAHFHVFFNIWNPNILVLIHVFGQM